ncbi:PQQ-dependent sugar dehydrogenase [Cryobacterium tepidiphilum]|uniref:PQQ-dependent sugar dehydrogenase n=2 Tax=Cryobacterium tepidiphilum TaxID=2486026 RepID=A0A3M8LPF3_9MICO|nr:PQQ-dependent sugar dehydrogenase [Cryobacterium tepidiphilum]
MHGAGAARSRAGVVLAVAVSLSLAACTGPHAAAPDVSSVPPSAAAPSPSPASPPAPTPSVPATPAPLVHPVGEPVVIASNLDVPWSILRLPGGGTLISERDSAQVVELLPDGRTRVAGTVPGVEPQGEGGLLGLATPRAAPGDAGAASVVWVYAYFTSSTDNRVVRMPLAGEAGSYRLGAPELVVRGIPKAGNHNGGRLGFGPDGMLYVTAGDAGNSDNAQDRGSLGGKILRMTPTGDVPPGNPFGTLVYSFGHRNPQGIAWDSSGQLWASEFGQNTWDELNRIVPGGNYGWPVVEGAGGGDDFIDPVQQWPTDAASPSGIAIVSDTIFMVGLRGERLWQIDPSTGEAKDWFVHRFGRLRDVVSGPDGTLWFVSNNTDGRGTPAEGDDRLYQVRVAA